MSSLQRNIITGLNMKIIMTENKLERIAIKWLNDNYGDLVSYKPKKHNNYIFYKKDDEIIFDVNKLNGYVHISNVIWSFLQKMFGMSYEHIQKVTKEWIDSCYNLNVYKTDSYGDITISRWKN